MKTSIMLQSIASIKSATITAVEGFLKTKVAPTAIAISIDVGILDGSVDKYTKIMKQYDALVDHRCGITQYEIDGPTPLGRQQDESKITIRDARKGNDTKPEDVPESWMQAIVAQARGVSSLLDMDKRGGAAHSRAQKAIAQTCGAYCKKLAVAGLSPKDRKKIVDQFSAEMVEAVRGENLVINGAEVSKMKTGDLLKVIGDARDFCNFGETQNNIVSISKAVDGKNVILASMKLDPMSEKMKKEYQKINTETLPQWFEDMTPVQQALTKKHLPEIIDGQHAIPTQLRYLPGLKNAYLDVKGLANAEGKLSQVYTEAHSGTMVHGGGQARGAEVERVTGLTLDHAASLAGAGAGAGAGDGLVLSLLNSNSILNGVDRTICQVTAKVSKDKRGVSYNQNGVNLVASNPDKALKTIEDLSLNTTKTESGLLWTMCKSGKDRTFGIMTRNAATQFGMSDKSEAFAKAIGDTGHAEAMAAGAGATRGAYGLKLKEMFIRMKDKLLCALKGRFSNEICQVNNMSAAKPGGTSVYSLVTKDMSSLPPQPLGATPPPLPPKRSTSKKLADDIRGTLGNQHGSSSRIPIAPNAVRKQSTSPAL